ncbi:MAG: TatD family hydrolase [Rectinemataceae bacterium]|nr:TatD family hydrolase [Rectinemataceae bacterium]
MHSGALFTDTHAHLSLVEERLGGQAVKGLLEAYRLRYASKGPGDGIERAPFIVDIGTRPGDLRQRLKKFGAFPFLRFSAGLWPGLESLEAPAAALAALASDLDFPQCSALGECGLDYHHMLAPARAQIALFEAQADMALQKDLPLIVHSREAFEDTLAVVTRVAGRIPVVIHCFGYGAGEAAKFLDAGCTISFAGNLSYKNSEGLRASLVLAPLDKILFETDSPYMNPLPSRGKPSTSLDIGRTMECAAALRTMPLEALALAAQANALRIFPERGGRSEVALP